MGWSETEMKLNNARLKTLPLDKSVCDGANLYFTRTGPKEVNESAQRLGSGVKWVLVPTLPSVLLKPVSGPGAHSLIHQGKDPLYERREAERQRRKREGKRFSDIARQYIEEHKSEWTNAKHARDWASTLERLAYPALDQKPFADLTTEDVIEVLSLIWQSKRETAKKLQGRMKLDLVTQRRRGFMKEKTPQPGKTISAITLPFRPISTS